MNTGGGQKVSLLDAIEASMAKVSRPMSGKEIASLIQAASPDLIGGKTPWKTVGARLASDIKDNPNSVFIRAGRGSYALKKWGDVPQFIGKPRKVNPLEENILVVPRSKFLPFLRQDSNHYLCSVSLKKVMYHSVTMRRSDAEKTDQFVQLIPSFIVFKSDQVLSYKRTKKSPESRLHETHSIIFGGHLQEEDNPSLFQENPEVMTDFIFRELYEELTFSDPIRDHLFCGILYLQQTKFERQHAGIVFAIEISDETNVSSGEPGYHSNLEFINWDAIEDSYVMRDTWSNQCVQHLKQSGK